MLKRHTPPGRLTQDEAADLHDCEAIIYQVSVQAYQQIGSALKRIRDQRLYRADYPSFEAYCEIRWELQKAQAYQYIDAATVAKNLIEQRALCEKKNKASKILDALPNKSQAYVLAKYKPAQQLELWEEANRQAPNGRMTAAYLKEFADTYTGTLVRGVLPPRRDTPAGLPTLEAEPVSRPPTEVCVLCRQAADQVYCSPLDPSVGICLTCATEAVRQLTS